MNDKNIDSQLESILL